MTPKEFIHVLIERRNWLNARIAAKEVIGWDTNYDMRERDALTFAIDRLSETVL